MLAHIGSLNVTISALSQIGNVDFQTFSSSFSVCATYSFCSMLHPVEYSFADADRSISDRVTCADIIVVGEGSCSERGTDGGGSSIMISMIECMSEASLHVVGASAIHICVAVLECSTGQKYS